MHKIYIMKFFRNKITWLLLLIVFVQSCKKTVDLLPTDDINEAVVFQKVADLEQGLYGAYASWNGENTMYIGAIAADEAKISNENRGQGQFEFKWQYVPSQGGSATAGWNSFYLMIGRINKVLNAALNVVPKDATETTQKQIIEGELKALRAISHFELLQRFGAAYDPSKMGIPYTTGSDLTAKPSRQTISEVITGIENDLSSAKSSPISAAPQAIGTSGVIRLSKAAIAGYQARVALFKKDWGNAVTFATEAITLSGKGLATQAQFPGIWSDLNETELLLKLRRTGTGVGTLWQDNNGDVFFEPSDKLKAMFNRTTDIRFPTYFAINPTAQDTALVNKFAGSSRGPKIVDVKLMRIAEMYLIRAEAKAENNDLPGAAVEYNALRAARITGYTNETFTSKDAAITAILNERFRELCYEGFRFFDLKRRGLPVDRLASDVQSTTWQNLAASDFRIVFPLPESAMLANPNLIQNNGY